MPRHTPHSSDAETDYSSRRMSSSAASDSSLHSARADKRPFDFSPSASPVPKKIRPDGAQEWSPQPLAEDDARSELSASPRVQLPSLASTFTDRHELRRTSLPSSLHDVSSNRLRLPTPHRSSQSHSSGLTSYQFPSAEDPHGADESRRPRLTAVTQIPLYQDYSVPGSAFSGSSTLSIPGNSPLSGATSVSDDAWAPAIVRPASTPSHIPASAGSPSLKYADESTRQAYYGGVSRIAGQHHHTASQDRSARPLIKTEGDWAAYGATTDFGMSASSSAGAPSGLPSSGAPSIAVTGSPTRSPVQQQQQASLVERPPRKRGKLPKPVTDYLKDWLHRHSDHPYPSEEEKKALCNATGLSMSQVSNWMINVRHHYLSYSDSDIDVGISLLGTPPHPRPRPPCRRRPTDEPAVRGPRAAEHPRQRPARVDARRRAHALPPDVAAVAPRVLAREQQQHAAHGRHGAQHEQQPRERGRTRGPRAPPVRARRELHAPAVRRGRRTAPVGARWRQRRAGLPRRAAQRAREHGQPRAVRRPGRHVPGQLQPRVARGRAPGAVCVPRPRTLGVAPAGLGVHDAALVTCCTRPCHPPHTLTPSAAALAAALATETGP